VNIEVRALGAADNDALLALAASVDTAGGGFEMRRNPEFFAFARSMGEPLYLGAFAGNTLVGSLGVTRQKRFLHGEVATLDYVHDLRVAPSHRGPVALRRLLETVRACCARRAGWAFGTVFDANADAVALRRAGRLLGDARVLGRTIHVGFSTSDAVAPPQTAVREIEPTDAWEFYTRLAAERTFAPADQGNFAAPNGVFMEVVADGRRVAVAKLVDQSSVRRVFVNGHEFRVGYLAYFVSESGIDALGALLTYVGSARRGCFSQIFVGLSAREVAVLGTPPAARLSSATVGFGNVPRDIELEFHELSLM
jgi:hypothetical protein